MRDEKVWLDSTSFNAAISACEKGKHWERALEQTQTATGQESVLANKMVNGSVRLLSCRPCAMRRLGLTPLATVLPSVLARKATIGSMR